MIRILLVCAVATFLAAAGAKAQSAFDSDDDVTVTRVIEPAATEAEPETKEKKGIAGQMWEDSTLTLGYHTALAVAGNPEWVDQHISFRHVLETLAFDRYFTRLDWKTRICPKIDHRAGAKDRSVHSEANLREAYVQAGSDAFGIKAGSQMMVWGKADTVAVTDVAAPRDLTEFIFPDLSDMRFGQFSLAGDLYQGRTHLSAFVCPMPETDRLPDPGTRYFRPLWDKGAYDIREERPSLGDLEAGAKLDIPGGKTELSFMGGRFFINSPVFEYAGINARLEPVFKERYPGFYMAGAAVSHVWKNWLIKGEAAFKKNYPLQGLTGAAFLDTVSSDILDAAAGFEYNANDRFRLSGELSNRHLFSHSKNAVYADTDQTALYLTFLKDFLNDTLAFEYNIYFGFQSKDRFHDIRLTYDLTDQIEVQCQFTWFDIKDETGRFWTYRDEDRLALRVRYAL